MPIINILFALLLCSLLFVGVFIFSTYSAFKLAFGNLRGSLWFGSNRLSLKPHEWVILWIYVAGIVGSFVIHPLGAYLIGHHIHQLTSSIILQTIIFAIFACFQLILLAAACGVGATRNYIARQHQSKLDVSHREIIATLDNAKVDVIAKEARVIRDDGKYILAEVTLQIKNVPFSIPYYEMNIHEVGNEGSFLTACVRGTNHSIPNPLLKVTSHGDKWIFYDIFTKQEITGNSDRVMLRFEFWRVNAAGDELPKTITPRLGIWARNDQVYSLDYQFFDKPISVSFEKSLDSEG